jgi:hypothetical protein
MQRAPTMPQKRPYQQMEVNNTAPAAKRIATFQPSYLPRGTGTQQRLPRPNSNSSRFNSNSCVYSSEHEQLTDFSDPQSIRALIATLQQHVDETTEAEEHQQESYIPEDAEWEENTN